MQIDTPKLNQRPPMKKEAPHFINKKRTPKNARDSKASNKKRGTPFHESEMHP
jgi:hypothetical protein